MCSRCTAAATQITGSTSSTLSRQSTRSDTSELNLDENRFLACYLLVSQRTGLSESTQVGFTVSPTRRHKQQKGLILFEGEYRTRRYRAWYNIAMIHAFTTKTPDMQFK